MTHCSNLCKWFEERKKFGLNENFGNFSSFVKLLKKLKKNRVKKYQYVLGNDF